MNDKETRELDNRLTNTYPTVIYHFHGSIRSINHPLGRQESTNGERVRTVLPHGLVLDSLFVPFSGSPGSEHFFVLEILLNRESIYKHPTLNKN